MKSSEKRLNPRYLLLIPLSFRGSDLNSAKPEISTRTVNISRSGLFLRSPHRLRVGSELSLSLRLPTETPGSAFSQFRCRGLVVRDGILFDGASGYGIELEQVTRLPYRRTSQSIPNSTQL
jgi:hypothetical protein